jgi:hypothetical protein
MSPILTLIKERYPHLRLENARVFKWHEPTQTIYYNEEALSEQAGQLELLHEVGHATLQHKAYGLDIDLLHKEGQAWGIAAKLADKYRMSFDSSYMQACLDTYRQWIHARSMCPTCKHTGLQINRNTYNCFNCGCSWHVPRSRLCMIRRYVIAEKRD